MRSSGNKRRGLRPVDMVILTAVFALCVGLLIVWRGGGEAAGGVAVYQNGVLQYQGPIGRETEIALEGNLVVIRGAVAYMEHADCPDQICVKTGRISRVNQSIVCLPNRVIVKLTGDGGLDTVAR